MDTLGASLDRTPGARLVRWPFRVLAALLVAATLFAQFGSVYHTFAYQDMKAALVTIAFLPLTALLLRTGGGAVMSGQIVRVPEWPFASKNVAGVWVVISLVVSQYIRYS